MNITTAHKKLEASILAIAIHLNDEFIGIIEN